MRRSIVLATALAALCVVQPGVAGADPTPPAPPALDVTPVLTDLSHPWDVVRAPDGAVLTGERSGRVVVRRPDGTVGDVGIDRTGFYAESETGQMGLSLSPNFAADRTLYSCEGHQDAAGRDIRVVARKVDAGWTALTDRRNVVTGIPVGQGGRHGGCRVLAAADGTLYVGTGDTASPNAPQDRRSFAGKVLHINADGTPAAGNPDPASPIFTLGHRNAQGLAVQPGSGRIYDIEQGTKVDDEVNLLVPGGNYGYSPNRFPFIYDESVPMTDPIRVPGAREAVWRSGSPTLATPGGTFVTGPGWGEWSESLAVATQQGKKLLLLKLGPDGTSVAAQTAVLDNQYGRLRSVTAVGDGSLLVTTDNGKGDQVLRVAPKG